MQHPQSPMVLLERAVQVSIARNRNPVDPAWPRREPWQEALPLPLRSWALLPLSLGLPPRVSVMLPPHTVVMARLRAMVNRLSKLTTRVRDRLSLLRELRCSQWASMLLAAALAMLI